VKPAGAGHSALRRLPQLVRAGIERFWFAQADPRPLGFFRIALGLTGIVQVLVLWPSLLQLYGNFGFVQWALLEAREEWLPSIGKLCLLLQPYGVSANACVHGVFLAYLAALLGLVLGWRTRFFAVAAWLLHGLTVNSGYLSLYGVDTMLHIGLFYCVWMPVGASLALDRRRLGRPPEPSFGANVALRTLQLHLCIIYLDSGLAKLAGVQWRNGEAIWRTLMQPQFAVLDFSWLAQAPWVATLACWTVILVELGYPVLIWPARTRQLWVVATLALHLGVGVLMGLWMFSVLMMILTLAAFGFPLLQRIENLAITRRTPAVAAPGRGSPGGGSRG